MNRNKTPSRDEVYRFIAESPSSVTKREIAQAFRIAGGDIRIALKEILKELENEGLIAKKPGQAYGVPESLPTVGIIEITDIDVDGDVLARAAEWNEEIQGKMPRIEVLPEGKGHPALAPGDRALARLIRLSDETYEAKVIRRLDVPQGRVMGVVRRTKQGWVLQPADKRAKYDYEIPRKDLGNATEGDLAAAEVQPARGALRKKVRIVQVIGRKDDPKAISLIALHESGIRPDFPQAVLDETKDMIVPDLKGREDLCAVPLVTIDGADARDFDDAVFAEQTDEGFHLIVAIADVAHYVRYGKSLDREGYRRGNSTYFPDRVVPMLPEKLSNDLCSLRPHENRATLAVHLYIGNGGKLLRHKFVRGIMKSAARLTYEQVQAARDGRPDDVTGPLMMPVINPLYAAYEVLWRAREERGALDLDLPERKIVVNENNEMTGVRIRERLDSHKLIEEFMILANVAAAQALEARNSPCVYRVHDRPDPQKLDSLREFIAEFGLNLEKGANIRPVQINHILHKAAKLPYSHLISQVVLRAQAQAHYHPENVGHFGLALQRYAHFTSPIRRYADLLVHRSLIRAYGLGDGGLSDEETVRLEEMAQHISDTERTSMEAERNAVDRFVAAFLADRIGAQFNGRISGVTRFGLFVTLSDTGADGLIPVSTLPRDQYVHDERQHALVGRYEGRFYRMGAPVQVTLAEADPLTGGSIFTLVGDDSADIPGFTTIPRPLPPQGRGGKRHNYGQKGGKRGKNGQKRGRRR